MFTNIKYTIVQAAKVNRNMLFMINKELHVHRYTNTNFKLPELFNYLLSTGCFRTGILKIAICINKIHIWYLQCR